jgi:hypothetical protein
MTVECEFFGGAMSRENNRWAGEVVNSYAVLGAWFRLLQFDNRPEKCQREMND